ncbi:MAG: deoxynucleoside kinase [Saprospiraceae bacterium]|nr:deoxynucleoside kinase [Saprospiraceae bacterium]
MEDYPIPHQYVCIEGNIGSGKTSLATKLAKRYQGKLILEQFTDNPFLPYFYSEPERYAFPVEIFFMTERHKQLQKNILTQDLFANHIFADYCFTKTLLFAKNNLNQEEFRIFQHLFQLLESPFPNPDLLVYLHRSTPKLMDLIEERGRMMESPITEEYLTTIQNSYFEYFRNENSYPILIIDVEDMDFVKNKEHLDEIVKLLEQRYNPGVHRVSIH